MVSEVARDAAGETLCNCPCSCGPLSRRPIVFGESSVVRPVAIVTPRIRLTLQVTNTPVEEEPSDEGNISDINIDPEQEGYGAPDNIEEYDAGIGLRRRIYTESPYVILLGSVEEYPTELFIHFMQAKDAVVFALEDLGFSERNGPSEALSGELHRSLFATIRLVQEFWRIIDHIHTR
ncbi:uncharacterized protein LOC143485207 isoform X2 [Brachyhypopomus gauderio]|uniref:uncharacterized protein LOC143485207 isoform X2 n=1 Tax=Brachyhypopomus gauderio TaxID=698409 RepID=UPI0040438866